MAIIYCAKCGERFDSSLPKCPTCGWIPQGFNNNAAFGVKNSEDEPNESGSDNPKNPFGGQDGNDRNNPNGYGQNGYGQGSQGGYNPNGYGQNGYGQGSQGGYNPNGYGQNGYGQGSQDGYNPNGYGQGGYNQGNQGGYNPNGYGQDGYGQFGQGGGYGNTPQKRPLNIGQLVFSIINIVLGSCCGIGFILGIISLVLTITATNARDDYDASSKLNTAKILNIIALILFIILVIIAVAVAVSNPDFYYEYTGESYRY